MICHGGSNSILGAAAHALPLLCLPQGADQFDNAARCAHQGLGIHLLPAGHRTTPREEVVAAITGAAVQSAA